MIVNPTGNTELKLNYLNQLIEVASKTNGTFSRQLAQEVTLKRIIDVCDSIETDLGIKGRKVICNVTSNLSADTLEFGHKLKEAGEAFAQASERIGNEMRNASKRLGRL